MLWEELGKGQPPREEGGFWRGAEQVSGAGALAAAVGKCSVLVFHSLGLSMLFGSPNLAPLCIQPCCVFFWQCSSLGPCLQLMSMVAGSGEDLEKVFSGSVVCYHMLPWLSGG